MLEGIDGVMALMLAGFFLIVFFVACGYVTMALWNFVIPPIIGWKAISFWQAIALFLLSRILLGSFKVNSK